MNIDNNLLALLIKQAVDSGVLSSESDIYVGNILAYDAPEVTDVEEATQGGFGPDVNGWHSIENPKAPQWRGRLNQFIENARAALIRKYPLARKTLEDLPQWFVFPDEISNDPEVANGNTIERSLFSAYSKLNSIGRYQGFFFQKIDIRGPQYVNRESYENIIPPQSGRFRFPTERQRMAVNDLPFEGIMVLRRRNPWANTGSVKNHAVILDPQAFPEQFIEYMTYKAQQDTGVDLPLGSVN